MEYNTHQPWNTKEWELGWGIGWMAADALPLLLPFSPRSSTGQWPLVISTVLYHNAHYGVHTAPYICTHARTHVHAQTQTHAHTHVCVYGVHTLEYPQTHRPATHAAAQAAQHIKRHFPCEQTYMHTYYVRTTGTAMFPYSVYIRDFARCAGFSREKGEGGGPLGY